MNLNDRSLLTQLQVTVCIFRLNYALHLTVEGLVVCTFSEGFRMNCRFFEISMLRTRLPDAFHLVQNDNCHCQTLSTLKNAKFDLFGSEKASWQIWLRTEIG